MEREPRSPLADCTFIGRTIPGWHVALNTLLDGSYIADQSILDSRYGATRADITYWGIAFGYALIDCVGTERIADPQSAMWYGMELAEYDHGVLAAIIVDHWDAIPEPLREQLGGDEHVRGLAT